ncbi:hypothetical protein HGO53_05115 [Wolbachia endosymbiont of Diaphorina citri]|jgi:hypothetical protein|nr:hypothetical protein [Wolbachia endosymbiont of Diaphorina citri]QJT94621.1 hypothetical protein HGO48_04405 [Wolbachia endosymbiont of Diaphorina citri]QJT95860.1 hypothetical protein HGO49_04405 [Wolbachia endosymbiont of Diaphorina citri]QJT97222.1 hypothetical protein HGO53_05115 [Wolbachia endosymbiont of Diaphorina citri]QLK11518.1 hypothetical protein FK497_04465 [Wolbachia endosymbiont of Diaphorina citri]
MYLALLKQILSIVNRENDLNGNNIVEKIKEQIKKEAHLLMKNGRGKNLI